MDFSDSFISISKEKKLSKHGFFPEKGRDDDDDIK
jgi:hypothetical protein